MWLIDVSLFTAYGLFSLLFLILLALCNAAGRADEVKLEFQEVKSEWYEIINN